MMTQGSLAESAQRCRALNSCSRCDGLQSRRDIARATRLMDTRDERTAGTGPARLRAASYRAVSSHWRNLLALSFLWAAAGPLAFGQSQANGLIGGRGAPRVWRSGARRNRHTVAFAERGQDLVANRRGGSVRGCRAA